MARCRVSGGPSHAMVWGGRRAPMTQTSASIDATAAQWVARMDSENWTEADDVALEDWLNLDIRHRGALVQAQALWTTLSDQRPFQSINENVQQPVSNPGPRNQTQKRPVGNERSRTRI